MSVLHFSETMHWSHKPEHLKLHAIESFNEAEHLQVMSSLGGADKASDKIISAHLAFFYYWFVVLLYAVDPNVAYNFNEHVERHAAETYTQFIREHGDELRSLPAPEAARRYYGVGGEGEREFEVSGEWREASGRFVFPFPFQNAFLQKVFKKWDYSRGVSVSQLRTLLR